METLVLDVSYRPVSRTSWERAICLWFKHKVEIVESYPNKVIRSMSLKLKVPSVVRWLKGAFKRRTQIRFSRGNIYLRDNGRCCYCAVHVPRDEVTLDHVIPRVAGGSSTWTNLVLCCGQCNSRKGGRSPEEAGMRLLTVPVRPTSLPDHLRNGLRWGPHMPPGWATWLGKPDQG